MKKYKVLITAVLSALLCSCADNTSQKLYVTEALPATVTTTANIVEVDRYRYFDVRTSEYMNALEKCDDFDNILEQAFAYQLADINSDGTPEIIIQIRASFSCSAVFSMNGEKSAFMAEPDGSSFVSQNCNYSYNGDLLQGCIDGNANLYLRFS